MKTQTKTHKFRRFLCGLTAMATAALMVPMAAMAVEKNKTATDLVNDQTTVTLSIGENSTTTSEIRGADVVFVLDKSTSIEVEDEALKMLEELKNHAQINNLKIKVGVVIFNNVGNEILGLTELNDGNWSTIQNAFKTSLSSGTNMEDGIRKGMSMLAQDSSVSATYKHLVLVSDGVTYYWGSEPKTVFTDLTNVVSASVDYLNQYASGRDTNYDAYRDPVAWMSNAQNDGIEEIISQYETTVQKDASGKPITDLDPKSTTGMNILPMDTKYTSLECAIYEAGQAWADAAAANYQLYAFGSDEYQQAYPWAPNFVSGLSKIGGSSQLYSDGVSVSGMFNGVKNEIIKQTTNEIQSGSVTDNIGQYFDLAGLNNGSVTSTTFVLKVGNVPYYGTVIDNNTVSFDNGNYTVTYYPTSGQYGESFVWNINVPVTTGISLSYVLKVDRTTVEAYPPSNPDAVPTNGDTTLDYTDPDGENHEEPFTPPTVSIEVDEEEEEPVIPSTPSLTIRKIWENDDISTRPSSITVDIYRDGLYVDTIELYERYGWRDSYEISERYEDADWWVVESDVPAYYDSDVEEVRDNVFYITNTYEEPVIETPVTSEPESSKPSSEPSEVTPSGPSEEPSGPSVEPSGPSSEPSAPSSEPVSEPTASAEPTLPQTGQLWWPVPALFACGAVLVAFGAFKHKRGNGRHER